MDSKLGSFIAFKMFGLMSNRISKSSAMGGDPTRSETTTPTPTTAPDGEETARGVVLAALAGGIDDYETHCMIQQKALSVCSKLEISTEGRELPLRITTDSGEWAAPELKEDLNLVNKLEVESLVFNIAPFFGAGGLSALGSQAV